MLTAVTIIAGLLGGLGGVFAIAAAGSFKRDLQWSDYEVAIISVVALELMIALFAFFPLYVSILLSIVALASIWWFLPAFLRVPVKKRATTH